jgi:hypothetical protein
MDLQSQAQLFGLFFIFFSWSKRWTTLHLNAWFLVSKEVVGKLDKGFLI